MLINTVLLGNTGVDDRLRCLYFVAALFLRLNCHCISMARRYEYQLIIINCLFCSISLCVLQMVVQQEGRLAICLKRESLNWMYDQGVRPYLASLYSLRVFPQAKVCKMKRTREEICEEWQCRSRSLLNGYVQDCQRMLGNEVGIVLK